jgi:Uma2 family endonuclease
MVSKTRMTADEFFQLPETNQPTELIDGVLIMSPSPVYRHQFSSGRIYALSLTLIPNGVLLYAPMDVHFDEINVAQPDILWIADGSRCVIEDQHLYGPPDLIVEIFSPGTAKPDKKDKYELYQRFGVREYWMVDPVGQYVEVCVWKDGKFEQQGIYGADDSFVSPVLGGKIVVLKGIFAAE